MASEREQAARFRRLAEHVPGVLYQYVQRAEHEGVFTYISPGVRELYGLEPEAVMRDSGLMWAAIHPDDVGGFAESIERAVQRDEIWSREWRISHAAGHTRWIIGTASQERQGDGSLVWDGLLLDGTDRFRARQQLAESERRLQLAMEATSDGLFDWDIKTDQIHYSPSYFTMLGYEPDELPPSAEAFAGLVHSEDAARFEQALEDTLTRGSGSIELRVRSKAGAWLWVLSRAKIVEWDDQGHPTRMVGTNIDIDARKRAERALELERGRAQQYLDVASVMLLALDRQARVTLINPKGCEILGYGEDEIIGRDWFECFVDTDDATTVRAVFEQLVAGDIGPVEYYENPVIRPDGNRRLVAWSNSVLRDHHGEIIGVLSSGQDITERKREERLREALLALGALFGGKHALEHLYTEVAKLLCAALGYAVTAVELYDATAQEMVFVGTAGLPAAQDGEVLRVPVGETISGAVATSGEAVVELAAADRSDYRHESLRELGARTFVCAPVVLDGRVLGTLSLADPLIRDDARQTLEALQIFAGQLAQALDRRQAEDALGASERTHRLLTENSRDVIFRTRVADATYEYVSPSTYQAFGYHAQAFYDDPGLLRRLHPVGSETCLHDRWHELLQGERPESYEFPIVHGVTGETRWMHQVNVWITDDDGELVALQGRVTDVTERKLAEQALKQSETELRANEQRFRAVFQGVTEGILVADRAGQRITMANRAACEMLGYDEQEIVGLGVGEIHPADRRALAIETLERQARGEPGVAHELPCQRKQAGVFYADISSVAVQLDGRDCLLMGLRDVTERRQMAAQLAQADRLSSMGMLAAGVAHEINNPLSYTLYNLESLADDLPGLLDAVRRYQAHVSEQLGAAAALDATAAIAVSPTTRDDVLTRLRDALEGMRRIRDVSRGLGTFSRVEEDQIGPVSLTRVIDVALDMASNEIKYRARLVRDYGPNLPAVLASEGRLSQVFLNLIINATHAIEEGDFEGNEIRVRTWSEVDTVCVRVSDTGMGVAREDLGRLFEPFFTTKQIGVGSGLGLPISRNIVESYGGSIEVQSELGRGTSFTVRLPIRARPPTAAKRAAAVAAEPAVRGRVLIVDDEAPNRAAMAQILAQHEAVQAESGQAARQILETDQAFDLILCDMMMPDGSGVDLHAWLADKDPALAERLIFVTGGAFTPRTRAYLSRVSNPRLDKPFDVEGLRKVVGEMIRGRRRGAADETSA